MSLWAFRFLLFYICILCVQPQNRFTFLHPLHIADICVIGAVVLHFVSANQENRPLIRFGPATITALLLMFFSFLSLHMGVFQTSSAWNSDIDIIFKNSLVLILVEAMAWNVKRIWAVQAALMLATLWWVKGGLRLSSAGATYAGDRLMGPAVSLIENPNGFAYLMTVMVPLYLYFFQQTENKWVRWGFLALCLASVHIIMETGSRTGLLALIAVGIFLIPKYFAKYKVALGISTVAIILISSAVGSSNVSRFKSIPDLIKNFLADDYEDKNPEEMEQDEQSAWERKMKNKHTWELIKEYPVFGVGIQASDFRIWEQGDKFPFAAGQVHNEILYAGKQMGIVGMGLYLSFMTTLFVCAWRAQLMTRRWWPEVADLAWTFKMQAVVFATGGFFSPVAWNPLYLVLAGSASALLAIVQELNQQRAPNAPL